MTPFFERGKLKCVSLRETASLPCTCGGIGRRASFRHWFFLECRFKSCHVYGILLPNFILIMSNPFPIVTLTVRENGEFVKTDTQELFAGKKIVLFGLPGAFTPTCSEKQLPGFEGAVADFQALGVDEVWCTSVNDDFVMSEWFDQKGIRFVKYIADGNGHLAAMLNQLVLKEDKGFGLRSWRYALVVNDMNVIYHAEESGKRDNAEEDPYEKSTPEGVLDFLKQSGGI